jgi:hypothetical protein
LLDVDSALALLTQMRTNAEMLLKTVNMPQPVTLQLLIQMNEHELLQVATSHLLDEASVRRLSGLMGRNPSIIQTAVSGFIAADIANYSHLREQYLTSLYNYHLSVDANNRFSLHSNNTYIIYFVYHGLIRGWDYKHRTICSPLIDGDDAYSTWAGSLIREDLYYESTVGLLGSSYRNQWPFWESFWAWF